MVARLGEVELLGSHFGFLRYYFYMEGIRREGHLVRTMFIIAFALSIVLLPFFYHLMSFLMLPILIPVLFLFAFVFFTGLTNFERRRMIYANIVLAILVIGTYEVYFFTTLSEHSHTDIHLNITVWLVQVLVFNLLFILYHSLKALKKSRELRREYGAE